MRFRIKGRKKDYAFKMDTAQLPPEEGGLTGAISEIENLREAGF